jgi:predicted dehydrogenase
VTSVLRAAVVGAGIGEEYVLALRRHPDVQVVAICARTSASADRIGESHGVPGRYTSYESMLEREALALVFVATPNYLHFPMTMAALEAGAHVACEKPLAVSLADARLMARRSDELGRCHFVPYTWRFLPAARAVKELLDAGFVGTPYHAYVRYHVRGWNDPRGPMRWQYDAAQAGSGALANVGSHAIALVQWWLGEIRTVCSSLRTAVPERMTGDGRAARVTVDDTCALLLELEDGTPTVLSISQVAFGPRVSVEFGLFGSDGALTMQDDWGAEDAWAGRVLIAHGTDADWKPFPIPPRLTEGSSPADPAVPFRGCYTAMVSELVSAIREGRAAAPDFHDGVRVQEVIEAALQSEGEERWVRVRDPRSVRERTGRRP